MDLFKMKNALKATSYDFYDKNICRKTRDRPRFKRMLHKLSRSRIKRQDKKELEEVMNDGLSI